MTQPHDPNVTSDNPSTPPDALDAGVTGTFDKSANPPDTDAPANDLPSVSGYRVLREIARGGMGKVLAAVDLGLDREVALKVLLPGANADRFVREAKITARLPHPGVPPVHALGTLADGSPFLAMKLIAGQTLADEMKTADRPRLLRAFTQVCQAVGFAHSRGVVHRDLKPANIMVGAFGEVQVMDWGLAKDLSSGEVAEEGRASEAPPELIVGTYPDQTTDHRSPGVSTDDQTQAGTVLGTPAYMAPEQARGEATDARADVFALGGILCAILTGQPPFRGKSTREVVERARAADLAEANARLNGCGADAELIALCGCCLSASPADRPADGQAVADELTAYQSGVQDRLQAAERERAVALAREAEQRKRRRVKVALAAAVVLLLLGGGAFAWYSDRQTTARRAEVRNREQQANQGVDAALNLVPELRKQYRFEAAKKTLDQAAALAKGGAPGLLAEVERAQRDLAFVVQLDDIRSRKWIWITGEDGKGDFNLKIAAPEYRQAFAQRDLDLTALAPAEAAKRIAASAVKAELVAAVDDWALHEPRPGLRNRLLDVARRADPGPWTDRFRDPAVRADRAAVEKLAAEADPARTSAATLSALAQLMTRRGLSPVRLLTAARTAHPAEFELAFSLAQSDEVRKGGQTIGPLEAARALRPGNLAVWINLANTLSDKGDLQGAIALLRQVIHLDPKFALAHNNLGNALKSQGKLDEAVAALRTAIRLAPDSAYAHANLGLALARQGKLDEAIAEHRTAIRLDPEQAESHSNLGSALSRQGKLDEAMAEHRTAIRLKPDLAEAHTNLGALLCDRLQDYPAAEREFRTAIRLKPELAEAHTNLGLVLSRQGKTDEAIAEHRTAIRLKSDHAEAHSHLGTSLAEQGKFDEAISEHRTAIRLKPDYAEAHGGLGDALSGQGKHKEAIGAFRTAIRLKPDYAEAHAGLGFALDGVGRGGEAMDEWRRSVALDPAQPNVWYWIARTENGRGRRDEAAGAFRKFLQTCSPGSPQAREAEKFLKGYDLDRAQAYARQGRWKEAAAAFARFFAVQPLDPGGLGFEHAAVLLLSGDQVGYRKLCARMLQRCGQPGSSPYHVARACTLAPDSVKDGAEPGKKAEDNLKRSSNAFWSLTEQGALAYRAGRYDEAATLLERSLKADNKPGRAVLNWVWLSLVEHRRGKAAEARAWLEKATKWLAEHPDGIPVLHDDARGLHLDNWLEAQVLHREAEALLRPKK
jgi:Flp pilus assembly protein TadD